MVLVKARTHLQTADSFRMTPHELAAFGRQHLSTLLGMSGEVLYSGADTLRAGDVYLLGHNPGGDSLNPALPTVGSSLAELPTKSINSYLDTQWSGRDTLQRRVIWLLSELEFNPRTVAASNLIFARSRDAATSQFETFAKLCWPVHERILEIVKPRLILVYGNSGSSPFSFLRQKFGTASWEDFPSGHGDWMCRRFEVPGRFNVVGLPHLSRYDITSHRSVIDWISATLRGRPSNSTTQGQLSAPHLERVRHPPGSHPATIAAHAVRGQRMTIVCPKCQGLSAFDADLRIGTFKVGCQACGTSFITLMLTVRNKRSSYSERDGCRRFSVRVRDEEGTEAVFDFVNVGRADLELRSKDVAAFSFLRSESTSDELGELGLVENKTVNQYLRITRPFDVARWVRSLWRK
ncbi:MAG: hypothetical protein ACR2G6_02915 [Gemmatimonadaceae bacterium]